MENRTYIAMDLKSFYASVECIERDLDPLSTNLVVADASRTEKTICLAVSPSLKAYGIPSRARLFEVVQKVKEVNTKRSPEQALDYIAAPPRMAKYIEYSTEIYKVYLKYIAPEDIHVYSIDEVFMDVTNYLDTYNLSAYELAKKIILDVLDTTGITATAGIGTNLYLAKIAMDIGAKYMPANDKEVKIAELDEMKYRRLLWSHRPLTDFWRLGKGYAKKLEGEGLYTMGDVARCSLANDGDYHNEDLLYKLFGINAELLIDHAWGWEPCTIADIKAYKPKSNSIGSGQVLHSPYPFDKAKLIVGEMTDLLILDLVDKRLLTDQIVLTLGYDRENLNKPSIKNTYKGEISTDHYGRSIPKSARGTINLDRQTSSTKLIMDAVSELFDRIADKNLLIRRVNITANHLVDEDSAEKTKDFQQLDLFTNYEEVEEKNQEEEAELIREKTMQKTILKIKKKYGKSSIIKGMNLEEGATTLERNKQIGGHKA